MPPRSPSPILPGGARAVVDARDVASASTAVLFLLAFADGDAKYAQPIQALVWMGGGYFDERSSFPAETGATPAEVERRADLAS